MNLNPDVLATIQQHGVSFILKVGFLIVVALFFAFLLVVLKQIRSMNTILTQPDLFPYLQTFTLGLILITLALFILSLVIL